MAIQMADSNRKPVRIALLCSLTFVLFVRHEFIEWRSTSLMPFLTAFSSSIPRHPGRLLVKLFLKLQPVLPNIPLSP